MGAAKQRTSLALIVAHENVQDSRSGFLSGECWSQQQPPTWFPFLTFWRRRFEHISKRILSSLNLIIFQTFGWLLIIYTALSRMTLLGKIGWINNSKYVVYICVVVYYTKFELFTSTSSGDEICWRCSIGDTRATSDDNFAIFPRPCTVIYVKRFQWSCVNNKLCQKKSPKVSPFLSLSIQLGLYICSPSLLWYPKGISNQKSRNDDEVPVIAQSKCSTTWNVVRSFE